MPLDIKTTNSFRFVISKQDALSAEQMQTMLDNLATVERLYSLFYRSKKLLGSAKNIEPDRTLEF